MLSLPNSLQDLIELAAATFPQVQVTHPNLRGQYLADQGYLLLPRPKRLGVMNADVFAQDLLCPVERKLGQMIEALTVA